MATIFEIDKEMYLQWQNCFTEDGEIIEEEYEKFKALQIERDKKVEGAACIFKRNVGDLALVDEEIKRLTAVKKRIQNEQDHLKNYIEYALDGQKFETIHCKVSYRTSETTEVDMDLDGNYLCPKTYLVKTVTYKPDKAKIKDALKEGKTVKGCRIESHRNIQVK